MAERRMFAKTIIDSDDFLDMPASTQLLYFHLGMRADDDGFINGPKKILRMVGASEDDLKLLIAKRFVIAFESGIVVIKHWKMHNYIQKDRYKPTVHITERARLALENNTYELLDTECIQNGYNLDTTCIQNVYTLDTQDRIGKDRLELGKDRLNTIVSNLEKPNYEEIVTRYNQICISLPKVKNLSEARKKAIKARLNTYSVDDIIKAFTKAEESDFLKGKNDHNWMADFDWIMRDRNLAKILDGNYDRFKGPKKEKTKLGVQL